MKVKISFIAILAIFITALSSTFVSASEANVPNDFTTTPQVATNDNDHSGFFDKVNELEASYPGVTVEVDYSYLVENGISEEDYLEEMEQIMAVKQRYSDYWHRQFVAQMKNR